MNRPENFVDGPSRRDLRRMRQLRATEIEWLVFVFSSGLVFMFECSGRADRLAFQP